MDRRRGAGGSVGVLTPNMLALPALLLSCASHVLCQKAVCAFLVMVRVFLDMSDAICLIGSNDAACFGSRYFRGSDTEAIRMGNLDPRQAQFEELLRKS